MRHCGIVLGVLWLCTGCGSSSGPADVSSRSAQPPMRCNGNTSRRLCLFWARHNHTQRGTFAHPAGIEMEAVYIPELGTTDALMRPLCAVCFLHGWYCVRTQKHKRRFRGIGCNIDRFCNGSRKRAYPMCLPRCHLFWWLSRRGHITNLWCRIVDASTRGDYCSPVDGGACDGCFRVPGAPR